MQPRGLSKATSYSSKLESRNKNRQTKRWTRWFVCWSSESPQRCPYVSVEVAWVAHQEPTPSRVSFNRFPHSTISSSFLAEVKQTFTNFFTAHHNLVSSRVTPSRLGGFTSKSNKYHEDCFTNLQCSQRGSHSTLTWISHKSHKPH
jgi:hypothetical protein